MDLANRAVSINRCERQEQKCTICLRSHLGIACSLNAAGSAAISFNATSPTAIGFNAASPATIGFNATSPAAISFNAARPAAIGLNAAGSAAIYLSRKSRRILEPILTAPSGEAGIKAQRSWNAPSQFSSLCQISVDSLWCCRQRESLSLGN